MFDTTDAGFKKDVLESDLPVLVDFWAPWCAPCRMLAPRLEAFAQEFAGKIKVVKVNVDENRVVAGVLGVRGIPALVLFDQGEVVSATTGVPAPEQLNKLVASVLR